MKKSALHSIFFVALIYLTGQVLSLVEECPAPEDSYPCYCEDEEDASVKMMTILQCNYLNETAHVDQALKSLHDYKIYKILLYRNELGSMKADAFKGPTVTQIHFTNTTFQMSSPQFTGQEKSLSRLTFVSCFDKENPMKPWSFGHLEALRDVTFDRNTIDDLSNDWLISTGPSLRSITFSECRIKQLGDKVFSKVVDLATLFLSDNGITSISRSMFPKPAENLRTINLNNNKLQDLPDDIFKDMPSLRTIELTHNLLKTISQSAWSSIVENLSRVYLDENPLRCDKSLKWISKKFLPKTFSGTCLEPPRLKGKSVRILTPADFH